jgi:hypothetical protein
MASTQVPIEAFDYAKIYIKRMPLDQVKTQLINRVSKIMWMHAPWRWTLGSIPIFTLTAATQNYTITYPADWLYALTANVSDGQLTEPNLEIVPLIETVSGFVGSPKQIAFTGTAGQVGGPVQITPVPAQVTGTKTVNGLYKKKYTPFTNETIYSTVVPFPDEWFDVFEDGMLWAAYQYADDKRAGDASMDASSGKLSYSGQRAIFEAGLMRMSQKEPLLLVDPLQADAKDTKK